MISARLHELATSLAEQQLGFHSDIIGRSTVESALRTRMRCFDESPSCYLARLSRDPDEQHLLLQLLLISESWFCREMEPLREALQAVRQRATVIRVLSVPCARGEEAISALFAAEQAGFSLDAVSVEGYDLSTEVISQARTFTYGTTSFRKENTAFVNCYFDERSGIYTLRPAMQKRLSYDTANLLASNWTPQHRQYELILCRNLLIYLTPESQRRLLQTLMALLSPVGYLVVAAAEAPIVSALGFEHSLSSPLVFTPRLGRPNALPKAKSVASVSMVRGRRLTKKVTSQPRHPALGSAPPGIAQEDLRLAADRGDAELAFERTLRALEESPQNPELHFLLGVISASCGQTREASTWFRRVLELAPEHEEALFYLGLLDIGEPG